MCGLYFVLFEHCANGTKCYLFILVTCHVLLTQTCLLSVSHTTYPHLTWMELAQDRRSKLDITKDELQDATAGTMWPITYCVNHSNISIQANWNYANIQNCLFAIVTL